MRFRICLIALLCASGTTAVLAQSGLEYTRKLTGTIEVNALGEVSTYTLQPVGVPAIDQSLGSLVESWSFQPVAALGSAKTVKAEFVINMVRASLAESKYTLRRIEFYPENVNVQTRRATTAEE